MNPTTSVYSFSAWITVETRHGRIPCYGPTPLIAAMRCYVASKLGDEVEIPDDLIAS